MIYDFLKKIGPMRLAATVFAVLALFILIVDRPGGGGDDLKKRAPYLIPRLIKDQVDRVEIASPGQDSVTLDKKTGDWMLEGATAFPADRAAITDLLNALEALQISGVVSENPERHTAYGVDDAQGISLKLWQKGKPLADFYLGNSPTTNRDYARMAGAAQVVEIAPALHPAVALKPEEWKEKLLLRFAEQDLEKLTLTGGENETVFTQTGGEWKVTVPEEYAPNAAAMESLWSTLKNFRATGFVTPDAAGDYNIHEPLFKISMRFKDERMEFVYIVKKNDDGDYLAKKDEYPMLYEIPAGLVDSLFEKDFH